MDPRTVLQTVRDALDIAWESQDVEFDLTRIAFHVIDVAMEFIEKHIPCGPKEIAEEAVSRAAKELDEQI